MSRSGVITIRNQNSVSIYYRVNAMRNIPNGTFLQNDLLALFPLDQVFFNGFYCQSITMMNPEFPEYPLEMDPNRKG